MELNKKLVGSDMKRVDEMEFWRQENLEKPRKLPNLSTIYTILLPPKFKL